MFWPTVSSFSYPNILVAPLFQVLITKFLSKFTMASIELSDMYASNLSDFASSLICFSVSFIERRSVKIPTVPSGIFAPEQRRGIFSPVFWFVMVSSYWELIPFSLNLWFSCIFSMLSSP